MTDAGFQPALVVETSPQNFQVWLNHGRTLDRDMSTLAAKELAKRFGGDLSSADWRHFGRLAGFTNRKPERLLPNGLAPFVRLRQCEGRTYDAAHEFLEEVKSLADQAAAERANLTIFRPTSNGNPVRTLAEFHRSARYDGDLHRADMAWALHAASRGLSEQQIRDEILHSPRSFEERAHSAPGQLCGKNREQSAQVRRADPLSMTRDGRRDGRTGGSRDLGACYYSSLRARSGATHGKSLCRRLRQPILLARPHRQVLRCLSKQFRESEIVCVFGLQSSF